MSNQSVDHNKIDLAIQQMEADPSPSEMHGTLCGMLCINPSTEADSWFKSLLPAFDPQNGLHQEIESLFIKCYDETRAQINDPNCDFQLILPDDDDTLEQRTAAIGDWCQGYLAGLAMSGVSEIKSLPGHAGEICQDFIEISRAGTSYDVDHTEEQEMALQDLIEYVRVAVLLIYEELHPELSNKTDIRYLH